MEKDQLTTLPVILLGTTLLLLGAATYLYLSTRIEEEDIDFDLWDEDVSDYA
ncbi:hypothetical protein [Pontibacter roseus]|uniref:hypothetical protein n=1 Tax=Pontibacter roseus TaxID=336989 RepID=UPI00037A16CB|nr:hypothetical protein [Pontibacter roseus]